MGANQAAGIFLLAILLALAFVALTLMPGEVNYPGLMIGMSEKRVALAWGPPDHVDSTVTTAGVREQWVYLAPPRCAYFNNGLLYAWQE